MTQGNLFVVTAPSGAGKTSLVKELLAADPHVKLSVSYTTRPPRPGERDGHDYHFVSRETFEAMLGRGDFLESAEVYANYYGTSQVWLSETMQSGKDILLEIDWQGAAQVRRLFPEAIGVFILPPSLETLHQRLKARGQDNAEVIERRMRMAQEDIRHVGEFEYVIINHVFAVAVADLCAIFRAERLKISRQLAGHSDLMTQLTSTQQSS
jgi:guanylate kinase